MEISAFSPLNMTHLTSKGVTISIVLFVYSLGERLRGKDIFEYSFGMSR